MTSARRIGRDTTLSGQPAVPSHEQEQLAGLRWGRIDADAEGWCSHSPVLRPSHAQESRGEQAPGGQAKVAPHHTAPASMVACTSLTVQATRRNRLQASPAAQQPRCAVGDPITPPWTMPCPPVSSLGAVPKNLPRRPTSATGADYDRYAGAFGGFGGGTRWQPGAADTEVHIAHHSTHRVGVFLAPC